MPAATAAARLRQRTTPMMLNARHFLMRLSMLGCLGLSGSLVRGSVTAQDFAIDMLEQEIIEMHDLRKRGLPKPA